MVTETDAGAEIGVPGQGATNFATLLLELRRAAKLTQEALAERSGLSARAIQHLEAGDTRPYRATVQGLVRGLGLTGAAREGLEAAAAPAPRRRRGLAAMRDAPAPPSNLPARLTSFVGRERELHELRRALSRGRLVTLTGPGGCGKTRLALEAAASVAGDFPDGVWLVELAALPAEHGGGAPPEADSGGAGADGAGADGAGGAGGAVARAIGAALGVREAPPAPLPETLAGFLRPRRLLLLLDNCEHVVRSCARVVDGLLRACPQLGIAATSREPLRISGEAIRSVPPLDVPPEDAPPETLAESEAVRLFVERAVAVHEGFGLSAENGTAAAVAQICRRLDGMPLAIELAAARLRVMTVGQMAQQLEERTVPAGGGDEGGAGRGRFRLLTGGSRAAPARQQTLRAAVDWSYALLDEAQRAVFNRLGVFAGGFTLEGVERVAARDGDDALDALTHLVDRSLVVAEGGADGVSRFRLLETLRAYAAQRLAERGEEAAIRDRHAAYYLWWAEERGRPRRMLDGFRMLEAEYGNLRAALARLGERASAGSAAAAEQALRLLVALQPLWVNSAHAREGRLLLETTMGLPAAAEVRADVLVAALAIAGHAALLQSDLSAARAAFERGLAISRASGDAANEAECLWQLGRMSPDPAERRALLQASVGAAQTRGARTYPALIFLGVELRNEEPERAREFLQAGLADARARGERDAEAHALARLAALATDGGEWDAAEALFEQSLAISRQIDAVGTGADTLCYLAELRLAQGDLAGAEAALAESLERARLAARPGSVARALRRLAEVSQRRGMHADALRLAGAVAGLRASYEGQPVLVGEEFRRAWLELGEEAARRAWRGGEALSMEGAIEEALERCSIVPARNRAPSSTTGASR